MLPGRDPENREILTSGFHNLSVFRFLIKKDETVSLYVVVSVGRGVERGVLPKIAIMIAVIYLVILYVSLQIRT